MDFQRLDALFEVVHFAGPDDWRGDEGFMQHPGQGNLCWGGLFVLRQLNHAVDDIKIRIFEIHIVGKGITVRPDRLPITTPMA